MDLMAMAFAVDVFVTAICLFIATKLVFLDARFWSLLGIVTVVSLVSLLPYAGWVLGLCVFVYLLKSVSNATLAQCILVAIVTRLIALGAVMLIRTLA